MSQKSKNAHTPDTKLKNRPTTPVRRLGKRTAAESRATRKALLKAAAAAFSEHGFNGAKLDDIADRASVTKGAIYGHFNGREDLLVEACRSALRELNLFQIAATAPNIETFINKTAEALLAPESKDVRMLNIEVHLSATRSEVMAGLLSEWHAEGFKTLKDRIHPSLGSPQAIFSMIHVLHLGLSHIDALNSFNADRNEVLNLTKSLAASLVGTSRQ